MTLFALDDLDDALDATRAFLWPFDRTTWAKLALVVVFLGGAGVNANVFQWNLGNNGGTGFPMDPIDPGLGAAIALWVAAIVLVLLAVGLAVAVVSAIMEFVFVESLRSETVSIREYWGRYWRKGLRLFGFRLLLGVLVVGSVLLLAAPLILTAISDGVPEGPAVAVLVGFLPFVILLAIFVAVVDGFTTLFVVPVMLTKDVGIVDGWRRLWPTITHHWTQYLAFAVAWFFLTLFAGILVGILTAVAAVLLLVLFGVFFGIGAAILISGSEAIGLAVLVLVGIVYVLSIVLASAVIQVPVQTYLRYYVLLVLGDIEADFDLIPERRAAIREAAAE